MSTNDVLLKSHIPSPTRVSTISVCIHIVSMLNGRSVSKRLVFVEVYKIKEIDLSQHRPL